MTFNEALPHLSLLPRSRKYYRALLSLILLLSLALPVFSKASEPDRCASWLTTSAALPGRVLRSSWKNVRRYKNYLVQDYGPAVAKSYGGRLIMRQAVEPERPRYLRPLPTMPQLGFFRRLARNLNPAHHLTQLYLGWPRDHSFHPIGGTAEWLRYRAHQMTARLTHGLFGRPLQFTLPVIFALTAAVPTGIDYGLERFGEYRAIHDVKTQAEAHSSDYLNLARTDFRYHDIAQRFAASPRSMTDLMKASFDVRLRIGFFDAYYNQGLRAQHFGPDMSDEDLDKLMELSFFKPLDTFRKSGIPDIPGYRLLPGASAEPISNERLGLLVELVDRLMMRYQTIEDWVADKPEQYRLLRLSPLFGDLTDELDHDPFAQSLLKLHHEGKLNALQLKLAAQESAYYQIEFEKCKVLRIEKVDVSTGQPVDIESIQADILRRVTQMPDGMFKI